MAHVAKYTASASGHMSKHYERAKDEKGEYIKFGNQDIDTSRTHLNYNLAPERDGGQIAYLHKRLSEIKVQKRADVNVFCSWVVTMPQKYEYHNKDIHVTPNKEQLEKQFFERTYKFLADRYGEQNVISAYVHMDEKTPHMHFAFVPAVDDKKWNEKHPDNPRQKLSAKDVLTRTDLRTFHTDLEQHLDRFQDWHFEILNEATKEGNKSIEELKRETAVKEVAEVREKADKDIDKIHSEVKHERMQADVTISGLKAEIKDLERKRDGLLTSQEISEIKGRKTIFGGLKGVSYKEFEAVKKTAIRVDNAVMERDVAVRERDGAVEKAYAEANAKLIAMREKDKAELDKTKKDLYDEYSEKTNSISWKNVRLERENEQLLSKVEKQDKVIEYLKAVIRERVPDMIKSMESKVKEMMSRTQGRER